MSAWEAPITLPPLAGCTRHIQCGYIAGARAGAIMAVWCSVRVWGVVGVEWVWGRLSVVRSNAAAASNLVWPPVSLPHIQYWARLWRHRN